MHTHSHAEVPRGMTPSDCLREWEGTMRRGTDAARSGQPQRAGSFYLKALALSRALLGRAGAAAADDRSDDCVAAFVVTHLNLADLQAEAGETELAALYLGAAHCALMALLRDPGTDPAWRQAACRHSRETHAALLAYLDEHGHQADILAALHAGCLPFPPSRSTLVP